MYFPFLVLYLVACTVTYATRVIELSDQFPDIRKEGGYWLVKFYAPWCGHCKRMEPVWAQVAQALYNTNIKVSRVDCSRFPAVASVFGIRGYPTIKFVSADTDFTFTGDRNKEDILNFAIRMAGPPVQEITKPEILYHFNSTDQLFFMYIGTQDSPLWYTFHNIASKMQPHGNFYYVRQHFARQYLNTSKDVPVVLVRKDNGTFFYPFNKESVDELNNLNTSLFKWVNEERFSMFLKVTRGNMNELLQTEKYLVLVVLEENKLQQIPSHMLVFKEMVKNLVRNNREKYHKFFQFGWISNPELANSIAMKVGSLPYLLVLNSTNHYHILQDESSQMTSNRIDVFLERILNQSVPAYGGNGVVVRLYRTYFDASMALAEMWKSNPVLTTVLFGLPLSFLAFILYSICCGDILDEDEEEEDTTHVKED